MYAVILAGGRGERFWPYSRKNCPKQFLSFFGNRTMLQQTADRLEGLVEPENTMVITGVDYIELVKEQLPWLPPDNIIGEPAGRDTAPAVGLGVLHVACRDPKGVMLVLPADHYIADVEKYKQVISGAAKAAYSSECLVTMGILPTRPETGYGYIKQGKVHDTYNEIPAYKVEEFTEKPDMGKAVEFLSEGNYLWNSGMFIWRADVIRNYINELLPELGRGLDDIEDVMDIEHSWQVIKGIYPTLPRTSIDYGVMEKAENVLVMPGDFGWDDVGSWTALERVWKPDEDYNVLNARGAFLDTRDCLVFSPRYVATLGVSNLIVVDNGESVFVCHKDRAQEMKKVIQALKEAGYEDIT